MTRSINRRLAEKIMNWGIALGDDGQEYYTKLHEDFGKKWPFKLTQNWYPHKNFFQLNECLSALDYNFKIERLDKEEFECEIIHPKATVKGYGATMILAIHDALASVLDEM